MSKLNKKNNKVKLSLVLFNLIIVIVSILIMFMLVGLSLLAIQQIDYGLKLQELRFEKEIALINNPNNYNYKEYADLDLLIRSIDKIAKDCGSTQITKEWGSTEWSTFHPLATNSYLYLKECYKE